MKVITVTKYVSDDGKHFDNEEDCLFHESLLDKLDKIMSPLEDRITGHHSDYGNGGGFIQQDIDKVREAKTKFLQLCNEIEPHHWVDENLKDLDMDEVAVSRLIDELYRNNRALSYNWYRFICIDKWGREWGQAYFKYNPEKGKPIQLNMGK